MGVLDSGSSDYLNRLSFHSGPAPDVAGLETTFKDNFTASAENFAYHFKSTSEEEVMTDLINSQLDLVYQAHNPDMRFNPQVSSEGLKSPKRDLTTIEKTLLLTSPLTRTAVMANMVDGKSLNDFGYEGKKQRFKDLTFDILKLQEQFPDMGLKTWDQIMQDAQKESTRLKEVMSQVSNNRTWGGVAGMLTGVMKEALTDPIVLASMMFGTSKIAGGTKSMNAMKAFYTEFLIGAGSETVIQPFVMDWSAKLETPWDLKDAAVTILTVGGFAGVTRAGGSYVVDLIDAAKAAKKLRAQGENVKAQTLENYIDLYNGAPPARSVLEQDAQLKAINDIQKAIDDGKSGPELQLEIERIAKETGIDAAKLNTKDLDLSIDQPKVEINVVGDRYDGGLVVTTKSGGKVIDEQILGGEQAYLYKGKEYDDYDNFAAAIAKDNNIDASLIKRTTDEGEVAPEISINVVGDRYDGGVVVSTKVGGKQVDEQILDGEQNYLWKGKEYEDYNSFSKAVADEYGESPLFVKRTTDEGEPAPEILVNVVGDRYDGGLVVTTTAAGKKIDEQILDGEQAYTFKGKEYDSYDGYAKAVAEEYGTSPLFVKRSTNDDFGIEPEIGKPVRLQDLDQAGIGKAEDKFRQPGIDQNLTANQYHKKAGPNQKELDTLGKELGDDFGDKVLFLSPGLKDLEKVKDKILRKKYDTTGELTDVIRSGFAVKNYEDVLELITRISNKYEVLDEGFIMNGAGYYDHKILIRFKNGQIGEIQLWEPHLLAAKEGRGYVRKHFTKDMKDYISGYDVPLRKDSGHNIYDKQKKLFDEDGNIKNQKKYDELNKKQDKVYSAASLSANPSWKSALESILPDSKISKGEAGSQSPLSAARRITNPSKRPSGGDTTTAGRPSQDTQSSTSDSLNINSTSKPIITGATERILLNDPEMARIIEEDFIEVQRIIDEAGDEFEIPFTVIDDLGNETTVIQSIKKVFNDIENDENSLASLNKCMGRAA
jgi:hypothetical protein